jgi:hypothetical protein
MRAEPRVDSKKFDITVAITNMGHPAEMLSCRATLKSAIRAAEKAGLPHAQLIDRIVRQGMKTVCD